jgi:glycosyltransferase involved in cell wall biosynthesis
MNILLLATHLNKGGISRYVVNLVKGLSARGHKICVASSGGQWANETTEAGGDFIRIPINAKSLLSPKILLSFFTLLGVISKNKIDIIHCNTRVTAFLGFLLSRYFKIPYITAFHGFYRPKLSRSLFKLSGTKTIAVSKAVKQHLKEDLDIDPERIEVVYNGIDVVNVPIADNLKKEWGFSDSDFLVGLLGRISAEKGHFLAVEALTRLAEKYINLHLLICGEGKKKEELSSYIENKSLTNRVTFVNCPFDEFICSLDILLVPSEKEGFGFSIVEAFARGVAVIGYNTGGIAEIIQNRKNAILFNQYNSLTLADSIEELMIKSRLREKLIAQAKEDVYNFSIENMAQNTERVYRLVGDSRKI